MTDLRDQLRTLVDAAAEPVNPDEVIGPRAIRPDNPFRRSRRPLVPALAGMAAVVLAAVAVAVVATRDGPAQERTTTARTGPTLDPASCYPDPCRDVNDDDASALLGAPVAMPAGIPEGWELVLSEVDFYPAGIEMDGETNPTDTVLLRRSWSPPEESYTEGCPTAIHLRTTPAHPGGRQTPPPLPIFLTLADGTPVLGQVSPGVCGSPTGEQADAGELAWTHAGLQYRLTSFGAQADTLRSIVRSLP